MRFLGFREVLLVVVVGAPWSVTYVNPVVAAKECHLQLKITV